MTRPGCGGLRTRCTVLLSVAVGMIAPPVLRAETFDDYALSGSFSLPSAGSVFDVQSDGRLVCLSGDEVLAEWPVAGGQFQPVGPLPSADVGAFGAAFLRVSPGGTRIAVGNNGGSAFDNYEIGVFELPSLTGRWLVAAHFDAEWLDDRYLVVTTGGGEVTLLDTESSDANAPDNPAVVVNIDGASAGVTLLPDGTLLTGDGFSTTQTGLIKAFAPTVWQPAATGGVPADFQLDGVEVIDLLSAASLGLDADGNLHIGGGDFAGGTEVNFAAVVRASAVASALAGGGAVDALDASAVRRFDPDLADPFSFYAVNANPLLGRLYLQPFGSATVFVFDSGVPIPATSEMGVGVMAIVSICVGCVVLRRRARFAASAFLIATAAGFVVIAGSTGAVASSFASAVVSYDPAPGQFVNHESLGDPAHALGPPDGRGVIDGNDATVVTLGGFGGAIVLAFDAPVNDDPDNPFGLDAIVFGNAFYAGGQVNRHWAECATIEIAVDANDNGLADDPWYLIPGSHLDPPTTPSQQTWDDDLADPAFPPGAESWIPAGRAGTWITTAHRLPPSIFDASVVQNPLGLNAVEEGVFGYADYSPTLILGDLDMDDVVDDAGLIADEFYTFPDDPYTTGVVAGSGGGDAFDIAWAVDAQTGEPAELAAFDFIRITNGVNAVSPVFGEKSPEIDAVADVVPRRTGDLTWDGDVDDDDFAAFAECFAGPGMAPAEEVCPRLDLQWDEDVDLADAADFFLRFTGATP